MTRIGHGREGKGEVWTRKLDGLTKPSETWISNSLRVITRKLRNIQIWVLSKRPIWSAATYDAIPLTMPYKQRSRASQENINLITEIFQWLYYLRGFTPPYDRSMVEWWHGSHFTNITDNIWTFPILNITDNIRTSPYIIRTRLVYRRLLRLY